MADTDSNRLPVDRKLLARFFGKIYITPEVTYNGVPCWLWQACLDKKGYARFGSKAHSYRAYRFSHEAFIGLIPEGLYCDHLCRRPQCVNPAHLEAVTNGENQMRGTSLWAQNVRKTHCSQGHEYTPENTAPHHVKGRKNVGRNCRKCHNLATHNRHMSMAYDDPRRVKGRAYCRAYYHRKQAEKKAQQ